MTFLGIHLAGCAVLVIAGIAKALRPDELARALRIPPALARSVAVVELALGLVALVRIGASLSAVAVGASYAGLTVYAWRLRAQGSVVSSCGCLGVPDTPVTRAHLLVTGAFAVAGGVVAVAGGAASIDIPLLLASAVVTALAVVVLTAHARVQAVRAAFTS